VAILHEAGLPRDVLQLVLGDGAIGAALVASNQTCGVIFTGSTEVAKLIQRQLANRTLQDGAPIPLVAETGGQNAMIVDSSALPEQVVRDVIASAFDSAGQRCSALRILCVQEDIREELLGMLRGAMAQLRVGATDALEVDIGPVISAEAQSGITAHIERMRTAGHRVEQLDLAPCTQAGTFVAPTIIEISDMSQLGREVFGPVLHVMGYARRDLPKVLEQINATGYGLTFGVHSRIDETIAQVSSAAQAGNIYVNRNVIGAVVGVQPFGGQGLSGTGPKAGGPLYLGRMVTGDVVAPTLDLAHVTELPGPVGERNMYRMHPRGRVLLLAASAQGLKAQLKAVKATGNSPVVPEDHRAHAAELDARECAAIEWTKDWSGDTQLAHVLIEQAGGKVTPLLRTVANIDGPIPIVQVGSETGGYRLDWMLEEVSTSIDTTAAEGNASLMAMV